MKKKQKQKNRYIFISENINFGQNKKTKPEQVKFRQEKKI